MTAHVDYPLLEVRQLYLKRDPQDINLPHRMVNHLHVLLSSHSGRMVILCPAYCLQQVLQSHVAIVDTLMDEEPEPQLLFLIYQVYSLLFCAIAPSISFFKLWRQGAVITDMCYKHIKGLDEDQDFDKESFTNQ